MEFTRDDYNNLSNIEKLDLLEYVINDLRLQNIDNPTHVIDFNYFINTIITKINDKELDNPKEML